MLTQGCYFCMIIDKCIKNIEIWLVNELKKKKKVMNVCNHVLN